MSEPINGSVLISTRFPPGGELAAAARRVAASESVVVVVETATRHILVASRRAVAFLCGNGGAVVDHDVFEFMIDRVPHEARALFLAGRITGYDTRSTRMRTGRGPVDVALSVRCFAGQPPRSWVQLSIRQLRPAAGPGSSPALAGRQGPTQPVYGTADGAYDVAQLSASAVSLFGVPVADIVGTTLLTLVAEPDRPVLMRAISDAALTGTVATATVGAIHHGAGAAGSAEAVPCRFTALPLQPAPGCAFVFVPVDSAVSDAQAALDLGGLVGGSGVDRLAGAPRGTNTRPPVAGYADLTPRELDVVDRLVAGDRVPAIARALFVSQSTVRTHVAAAARKLGARDQQELIDLFRGRS
ncbi:regulatory protein, luxR family [Jatrophihabitans endophyticus]|uniref:Regulatory protein, luxR family n=1 Tax=Jatrophihabitans endophyticus TaxID=1206085 RepID=A0A1M5SX78_9ACTN|nr:helix-turn-helix transcriptional regulator [Jatrophihabitans endophyticus]SHH43072.1 regulatory protein, luxR family [Jatrophihabitans endophyticus]